MGLEVNFGGDANSFAHLFGKVDLGLFSVFLLHNYASCILWPLFFCVKNSSALSFFLNGLLRNAGVEIHYEVLELQESIFLEQPHRRLFDFNILLVDVKD